MKKLFSRMVSFVLALIMTASLCAGCSANNKTDVSGETASNKTESSSSAPSSDSYSLPFTSTPLTLTYWMPLDSNAVGSGIKDVNEALYMKEIVKRTGISFKFIHPALGQESTQFNLMIASGDLPDLINYNFVGYNGGPEKAINDGVIIDHNDLMNKYAYNFNNFLKANPGCEKYYKTDSGKVYNMPCFVMLAPTGKEDNGWKNRQMYYEAVIGPALRADWLKELGLSAPTSIDEWYNVLKAFKEKKNATAPLTFQMSMWQGSNCFITAYNTSYGFYEDGNKKVLYGPYQPEYKKFLETFSKWYKEGLLDSDFSTNDTSAVDAKVLSGKSGAWLGYSAGGVGTYVQTGRKSNPNFDVVGTIYPSLKAGEAAVMGNKSYPYSAGNCTSITTANKHPIESMKYLDYFYSDEGDMLANWGVKGVSYDIVGGTPQFTDAIAKDSNGLPPQQAMMKYIAWAKAGNSSDFANRIALYKTYGTNRIEEAKELWGKTQRPASLPPVTIASEKSSAYAKIMSDIDTYVKEQFMKFVMGAQPMDNFDSYIAQLKKMGIDSAIKIQQEALDRYYKR